MSKRGQMLLLAFISGSLIACCWLPLHLEPLFPLSVLLAMQGLRRAESGRDAVYFGLVFGGFRYAVASHFLLALMEFSPFGFLFYLLAIAYILPFAVLESWGAWWLERKCRLPRSVGFGLLYVTTEWLRTIGDLSFPADNLAHGLGTAPAFLAWTPWIGPLGVTLLIMVIAMLLDQAWERRFSMKPAIGLATAAILLWLAPVMTDLAISGDDGRDVQGNLAVGIVQPSFTIQEKFDPGRRPLLWRKLERLTAKAARDADLVVWPESARPEALVWDQRRPFGDPKMEALARKIGVPILYGCEIARIEGCLIKALYNGAAIAFPDDRTSRWYGKQRLLPFAEGLPFADLFGYDPHGEQPGPNRKNSYLTALGKFNRGSDPTIFEVDGARIGVLICYEGMYPSLARRYRAGGANTLVVLTNDMWWGRSLFARWHARMVSALARGIDIPVLRAANSGVSSLTGRDGRMTAGTSMFEITTLQLQVAPAGPSKTFYARTGEIPIWIILGLFGTVICLAALRRLAPVWNRLPQPSHSEGD